MSGLSKNLGLAERVEEATQGLWRPARAGARLMAEGVVITGDIVLNTTLSYVAARIVEYKTRKGTAAEPLPSDLTDWMMQGASAVLGRYAHGKLQARTAAYAELAKLKTWQPVEHLFAARDQVERFATEAETKPSHDAALSTLGAVRSLFDAEHAAFTAVLANPAKRAAIRMDESSVRGLAGALERGTHNSTAPGSRICRSPRAASRSSCPARSTSARSIRSMQRSPPRSWRGSRRASTASPAATSPQSRSARSRTRSTIAAARTGTTSRTCGPARSRRT